MFFLCVYLLFASEFHWKLTLVSGHFIDICQIKKKKWSSDVKSFHVTFYFLLCLSGNVRRGQSGIPNVLPSNSEAPHHHHYRCPHSESLVGTFPFRAFSARQPNVFLVAITVPVTK